MNSVSLLIAYCALILGASLAGGLIPALVRLTHTRMQLATSFVAGLMLGVAVLHLLPHALVQMRDADRVTFWLLLGFLVMFFIQRFFRFHHHDVPEGVSDQHGGHSHGGAECSGHHGSGSPHASTGNLSWAGAAVGLTMHTLIDGFALAASVEAETRAGHAVFLGGLGTFLVIILHKPFDAMTIGTLMAAGGWSRPARHLVNVLFALAIPMGAVLFFMGADQAAGESPLLLGGALAFAAGSFLCIAASDLLPELQFHAHDRVKLSVALLAGVLLSLLIGKLEHDEAHDHETPAAAAETTNTPARP